MSKELALDYNFESVIPTGKHLTKNTRKHDKWLLRQRTVTSILNLEISQRIYLKAITEICFKQKVPDTSSGSTEAFTQIIRISSESYENS